MEGFLGGAYFWVKAFHIIFVIFWLAGMFMLPRYFAYHMQCDIGSDEDAKWVEREARVDKIILMPAMGISWILGLCLVAHIGLSAGGWLHVKLLLVFLFSGFHGFLTKERKRLAAGERQRSEKFYRMINEVPALVIIVVVILAVTKPF